MSTSTQTTIEKDKEYLQDMVGRYPEIGTHLKSIVNHLNGLGKVAIKKRRRISALSIASIHHKQSLNNN